MANKLKRTGKRAANKHIGSRFDDFLRHDGIEAAVKTRACREAIAHLVAAHMKRHALSKSAMARRMGTSRPAIHRLLDPKGGGLNIETLARAAAAVGKQVRIDFVDAA